METFTLFLNHYMFRLLFSLNVICYISINIPGKSPYGGTYAITGVQIIPVAGTNTPQKLLLTDWNLCWSGRVYFVFGRRTHQPWFHSLHACLPRIDLTSERQIVFWMLYSVWLPISRGSDKLFLSKVLSESKFRIIPILCHQSYWLSWEFNDRVYASCSLKRKQKGLG